MMIFVLKTRNFVSKSHENEELCIKNTRDFVFQMMNVAGRPLGSKNKQPYGTLKNGAGGGVAAVAAAAAAASIVHRQSASAHHRGCPDTAQGECNPH